MRASLGSELTRSRATESRISAGNSIATVRVPFVNTAPLTDLHMLIALVPVFWVLGFEQFVAVPLLLWSVLKYLLRGKAINRSWPVGLLSLFVLVMLLSALSIDSGIRAVTFVRTTAMYIMGILIAVIVTGECKRPDQVRRLLRTLVWMVGVSGAMALVGVLGVADVRFRSLAGYVLPQAIAETGYGNQIVWRFLGNNSWFQGLGSYFRVSSIFLFSTMCAAATAVTLPLALYFVRTSRGFSRLPYVAISVLIGISLLFSTGRVAWIAFGAAGLLTGILALKLMQRLLAVVLVASLAAGSFIMLPHGFVSDAIESTVYARGAGSAVSRTTIYIATLEGLAERPLLGWGTERDITTVENFDLPAGSHSYYLGIAYKHGMFGLLLVLVLIGYVAARIWSALRRSNSGGRDSAARLLGYVSWSLLVAAMIGMTSALDLDATLALIIWVVLFSGWQLQTLVRREGAAQAATLDGRGGVGA